MTQHSFLPPSGASAWSRCAMWPTMNAKFPQGDTEESLEGTAAHWVLSEMLGLRLYPEGHLAPNGVMVTGEMHDGAEMVLDTLVTRRITIGPGIHVEQTVKAPSIHPDCFGTPDIWKYDVGSCHLEIVDYKYGHGFVDEYFNAQGLLYMLGILEELKDQIINPMLVTVSFTIVQPRCFYRGAPVRTHNYTVSEAAEHLLKLQRAAQAAMSPFPLATTNEECGHCPGRHACDPLQEAAYEAAQYASDRLPHDLSPEAASLELRMLQTRYKLLGARITGLEELTLGNIRAGKRVPHHRIEHGKGRAKWNVSPEQVITMGRLLGKDLSKPEVITPAQAKKLGVDEAVINHYSQNTSGAAKLVPENNEQIVRVFKP